MTPSEILEALGCCASAVWAWVLVRGIRIQTRRLECLGNLTADCHCIVCKKPAPLPKATVVRK